MKRLTVIFLILILTLFACGDKKSPTAPTERANVVLDGDPTFAWTYIGVDYIIGSVINIGNATAHNVKITFYFYRNENAQKHFKSAYKYTKPPTILAGQKASYMIMVQYLDNYTGDDGKIWYTTEITLD